MMTKQIIGNAGEYFIAYILSKEGFIVTVTLGRTIYYDLIVINPKNKTIKIQVKTTQHPNINEFVVSKKTENFIEDDLFYAFVRLKEINNLPDFWILPSKIVADIVKKTYENWLKTPAKNGGEHKETPLRTFCIKSKFLPSGWEETLKRYKSNLEILKEF